MYSDAKACIACDTVLVIKKIILPLQCKKIARSGAVVARWAHNPKVVGSNPASATRENQCLILIPEPPLDQQWRLFCC